MSETLTTEQVEEILAGCKGVTPGPWFDENPGDDVTIGWVNDSDPLNDGGSLATTWAAGRPVGEGKINAAHIARLDPQTVSSLATELLALRKRVEWQDISTAPKDGTVFLGYEPHNAVSEMRWEAYDPDDAYDVGDEGYWSYTVAVMCDTLEPPEPTHWQPLPASPLPTPKEPS